MLLVDDVLATGGTMQAGCQLIEKAGGTVAACAFLVELAFLGGRDEARRPHRGRFSLIDRYYADTCELPTMTIDFDKAGGLVPAIAQDADTGEVLMLAWMNREAYEETLRTGRAVYFSRSRNKLWRKGEESGNVQEVAASSSIATPTPILLKVHQIGGAACHEGYTSCFFRKLAGDGLKVIGERVFDPKEVYKK